MARWLCMLAAAAVAAGCRTSVPAVLEDGGVVQQGGDAGVLIDAGTGYDGGTVADAGTGYDGGTVADAGTGYDAGTVADAGTGYDGGTVADAGTGYDAGTVVDAGTVYDAGTIVDAGTGYDAGTGSDAGTGTDAGTIDGGTGSDAGTGGDGGTGSDAGTGTDGGTGSDAGTDGGPPLPDGGGWTFYGAQDGVPTEVYGVSADEGGNLWVAGGEQGLFVLRVGNARFEQYTMTDGLRPYGYLPDGGDPGGTPYLKVISVAGGPAGVAFVGYAGIGSDLGPPPPQGQLGCEDNWDETTATPDPSIYKSGDADKVTLTASGIDVVHYDIFTGPNQVSAEPRGREKLCSILRIKYDKTTSSVWFGGNHGFAWGDPNHQSAPTCDGQRSCSGVYEHAHPAINGLKADGSCCVLLTGGYFGLGLDPTGDVWFGGYIRSTRFKYMTNGVQAGAFYYAQQQTEDTGYEWNRIDAWPDAVPDYPLPSQRVDDLVSGIQVTPDNKVWIGSFARGLVTLDRDTETVNGDYTSQLMNPYVGALAVDPKDGSVWIGHRWSGPLSRVQSGVVVPYDWRVFGVDLANSPVLDIQVDTSVTPRRVLVGFFGTSKVSGTIGVYTGD